MDKHLFMTYSANGEPLASEIRNLVKDSLVFDLDRKSIYAQGTEFGYVGLILNGPELQDGERKVFTDAQRDEEGNIILTYTNANASLVNKAGTIEDHAYIDSSNSDISYIYDLYSVGENIYYKVGYLSTRHSTNGGTVKNNGTYVINGVSLSDDGKLSYTYHNLSGNTGTINTSANVSLNDTNSMKVLTGISQSGDGKISYSYSNISLNPNTLTYHKLKIGDNIIDIDNNENYIYVAKTIEVSSPENSTSHIISYSTAYVPTYKGMQEFEKNLNKYNDALRYCGTVTPTSESGGTWSVNYVPPIEPEAGETVVADTKTGAVYKVDSIGYIGTEKVSPGDMIISYNDSAAIGNNNYWNIINENINLNTSTPTKKYFNNSTSTTNKPRVLTNVYLSGDGTLSYSYYNLTVSNAETSQSSPNSIIDYSSVNYNHRVDLLTNEENKGFPVISSVSLTQDGLNTKLSYSYTYIYSNKNHHTNVGTEVSNLTLTDTGTRIITSVNLSNDGKLTYTYSDITTSDILWKRGNGNFSLQSVDTNTKAVGAYSLAEGGNTYAFGTYSLAEGHNTYVLGKAAHGEGESSYAYGNYSHVEGYYSYAFGTASHAEGAYAYSIGNYSHSEGSYTYAFGENSHAEGRLTYSYGNYGHSEGLGTVTYNTAEHAQGQYNISRTGNVEDKYLTISTIGIGSNDSNRKNVVEIMKNGDFYLYGIGNYNGTSIDANTLPIQSYLSNMGLWESGEGNNSIKVKNRNNTAYGNYSVSEGRGTMAYGESSHTEGVDTRADGLGSHAEGIITYAASSVSHAEGYGTQAGSSFGNVAHAEGTWTKAFGQSSHAEGHETVAYNYYSHAEGEYTYAFGRASHAEGGSKYTYYLEISGSNVDKRIGAYWRNLGSDNRFSITYGIYSHTEGFNTVALGDYSHVEGQNNLTYGIGSHVEGMNNIGDGQASHVEGEANRAGAGSHAEGFGTYAQAGHTEGYGTYSYASDGHAEGSLTIVGGLAGHAEGSATRVYGVAAHAEGRNSKAYGRYSHSEGFDTITYNEAEHANGKYNVSHYGNLTSDKLSTFSIGIGTSNTDRKNAVTIMQNGDFYLYGIGNYDGNTINGNTLTLQTYLANAGVWQRGSGELSVQTTSTNTNASGQYSVAEGFTTVSSGMASHAEGSSSISYGNYSHAEGHNTYAYGATSHAEGESTYSFGPNSHVEGFYSIAYGNASHAEGAYTYSGQQNSHAEGYFTYSIGEASHSEGSYTYTYGHSSHAEGYESYAYGDYSHTEGYNTYTYGISSHAEGNYTSAYGEISHVEGDNTIAYGNASHTEGKYTTAHGNYSHTEGYYTYSYEFATGAHAEGYYTEVRNPGEHASGTYNLSTRLGNSTISGSETSEELEVIERNKKYNTLFSVGNGFYGTVEGLTQTVRQNAIEITEKGEFYLMGIGDYDGTNAQYAYSLREVIIEDELVTSYALNDLNERISTTNYRIDSIPAQIWKYGTGIQSIEVTENGNNAIGNYSISAGKDNSSIGNFSFSVGANNTASGIYSVAMGENSNANGSGSVAIGVGINTTNNYEVSFGKYNESGTYRYNISPYDLDIRTIFSVGIGSSTNNKKNALTISENGEIYLYGIGNYDGRFVIENNSLNLEVKSLQVYLEENERTISEALNDLNTRVVNINDIILNLPSSIFELGTGNKSIQSPTLLSTADGNYSVSIGNNTITNNESETAFGAFNVSNKADATFGNAGNTAFSIGAGTSESSRKNLLEVMQNGDIYLYGIGNYNGTSISGASTLNSVLGAINNRIDTVNNASIKSITVNNDILNKQLPDASGNVNVNITGFIGTTALQATSAVQDLTGIDKAYINKVIYSGAAAVSHDYTHIPSDSEIAITTGNGDGGVSSWIWRENFSASNWGIFHNNSTNFLHFVGGSASRLAINLSTGNVGVGIDAPTQKLHVNGGLLAITNNGNTLTIGSQNSSFLHIYNSANVPFIFNRALTTQGNIYPYTTDTYNLGDSTHKWNNLFVNNIKIGTHTISPINTNDIKIVGADNLNYYNWQFDHINLDVTGQVKITTNTDTAPLTVTSSKRVDNLFAQYANEWLPIAEKTYENYTCGTGNNQYLFFINVTPTTSRWTDVYSIRYKLIVNTSVKECQGEYDCYVAFSGSQVIYANFNKFYSGSYYPIYTHYYLYYNTEAKFNNREAHPVKIGARLADAYHAIAGSSNGTSWEALPRDYTIKIYEANNCTVSFIDPIETYAGIYNGTYYTYTGPNATSLGLQESGDSTDTTTMQLYYTHLTAGENGLKRYSLCMEDSTGKWQSFTTGTGGIGNTKVVNSAAKFKLYSKVYYLNMSGDIAANAVTENGVVRTYQGAIDYRNSLNLTNSTGLNLVTNKPIFIIGTLDSDGYFCLPSTGNWWTQDVPTSEDGKLYIMVSSAAYSWYQSDFINTPNIYWYKNGKFEIYDPHIKEIRINPNSNDSLSTSTLSGTSIDLTSLAGKNYVDTKIAALVNSAPAALDTLNELATALGNDSNFATNINNSIAAKLPLSGGTMTGQLKWSSSTALPEQTNPQYFLCIDSFANGGATKWASKANTLKALTGLTSTAIGSSTQPIYWTGTTFAISTPTIPGTSNGTASSTSGTITFVESISYDTLNKNYTTVRKTISVPAAQVQSDWNATSGLGVIKNKPTIPTVNNGTLTIQKNGTQVATFSANQSANATANIQVNELPTVSTLNNGQILQVVNGAWNLTTPVSIYSGSEVPNNSMGKNGDLYLQI